MLGLYYSITAIILIVTLTILLIGKYKKLNINHGTMVLVFCCFLIAAFFFRYMWADTAIQNTVALNNSVFDSKFLNAFALLFNWGMIGVILFMAMYPFFKNKLPSLNVIIKYYVLPMSLISCGVYVIVAKSIVGKQAFSQFDIRCLLLAIENGLLIASSFIVFLTEGMFKTSKSDLKVLLLIPISWLFTIPSYSLHALFGKVNYTVTIKEFSIPHRLILYGSIISPFLIYLWLHKKDESFIKYILTYLSLGALISFSFEHRFPSFLDVGGLPIHLCNTAMYIIPLCLIFKWNKLFYFTYFINVLGAFIAMIMPNYSSLVNLLDIRCVGFYINHYVAFFMPILIVALNVYKRPKLREFKYSMVGFGIYFAFVLICNAWFSNYGTVDYFFVNSDFVAEKLGLWAENLRLTTFTLHIADIKMVFYPVYQALFFLVYVLLGAGVWFLYEGLYSFTDSIHDILNRKQKIKLDMLALESMLNGREKTEPMNLENQNKMILNNFSKRYGKSSTYAVKDANLEIVGGEIFGFLGHNGAGKSTIIKSIVGIQPITSGSIEVCGYDVDKQSVMAKQNIGYVPDHYALYEKLTGREYINYIADLYGVSNSDRDERINKYVKLFELEGAFDNQIKTYSHGMKQKIAIMSALVHNPKVWILDEPLTGLDPTSIFQVKECMREHAKAGNIVFFSSHLIDIVEQLCDRIAIIKKGKILTCKKVSEIEETTTLEQFYLATTESNKVEANADLSGKNSVDKNEKSKQTKKKKLKTKKQDK